MSLFDFPRIHYSGLLDVNVPTINNAVYFPLTMYAATTTSAFIPPRLYFSSKALIEAVTPSIHPTIYFDEVNRYFYIEIEPINTIPILRQWCMTPIVVNDLTRLDAAYGPYYTAAANDTNDVNAGLPFIGKCPGYWNMYGDMGVSIYQTKASGVQIFDGTKVNTYAPNTNNTPDINTILQTAFDLDTSPDSKITTALMVETVSNQSCYANIFCSRVNVYNTSNSGSVVLQGKPFKFSAGLYSTWKVYNWMPAMSGAARFCSAIPLAEIENGSSSPLVQFIQNNKAYDGRPLKGLFVSFTIQEVFENRYDQTIYANNNTSANPAQCTTSITIAPWYDGDLISGNLGRNLISLNAKPIYTNTALNAPIQMTPTICSVKNLATNKALYSIDFGVTWPELMTPAFTFANPPAHRGDASFETANLGNLLFYAGSTQFASIALNPGVNPMSSMYSRGNIFDFVITDSNVIQALSQNLINVYLTNTSTLALQESTYYIATDQKGPYTNQGDDASDGFMVYSNNREPIILRILQRGVPISTPINIGIAQYIIPEAANDPVGPPSHIEWVQTADGYKLDFMDLPFNASNNAVYYFIYKGLYPGDVAPSYTNSSNNYTVMDTGSFICMRVYPQKDYDRYLNPSNPNYAPPDFGVIYNEIFKLYDVVYPIMALKHPFVETEWNNGTMAGAVLQRTDPKFWNNIIYMPRSREISESQRKLLKAWADQLLNKA